MKIIIKITIINTILLIDTRYFNAGDAEAVHKRTEITIIKRKKSKSPKVSYPNKN